MSHQISLAGRLRVGVAHKSALDPTGAPNHLIRWLKSPLVALAVSFLGTMGTVVALVLGFVL